MYYVYILENPKGRFYIGQTQDIDQRLIQHNQPLSEGVTYPRKNGPWKLVHREPFDTRSQAVIRERQIKKMKSARWIRENLLKYHH